MSLTARLGAATTVAVGAALLAPLPAAEAAPTVSTRIAGYSIPKTKITRGQSITVKGQVQRLRSKKWSPQQGLRVTVWFDQDGPTRNRSMGTFTVDRRGNFARTFKPSASGYWSVKVVKTRTYKASGTSRKYVKVTTPTTYRPAKGSWNCPNWAPIKGNASSRIYHRPGQRYYSRTKPEACFSSAAAAVRAGYRAAKV